MPLCLRNMQYCKEAQLVLQTSLFTGIVTFKQALVHNALTCVRALMNDRVC